MRTGPNIIAVHRLKNAGMSIGKDTLLSDMIATTACCQNQKAKTVSFMKLQTVHRLTKDATRLQESTTIVRTAENIQLSEATIIPIDQNEIFANPDGVRVASI